MNLIDKYFSHGRCDLNGMTRELSGMNHKDQICLAEEITPRDYAVTDTTEAIIEQNADLIASYYDEYKAELSRNRQLKEFLAQKLGEEFIAMMGRME